MLISNIDHGVGSGMLISDVYYGIGQGMCTEARGSDMLDAVGDVCSHHGAFMTEKGIEGGPRERESAAEEERKALNILSLWEMPATMQGDIHPPISHGGASRGSGRSTNRSASRAASSQ